jgi:hypothetical protein
LREALIIYIHVLQDLDAALKYCQRVGQTRGRLVQVSWFFKHHVACSISYLCTYDLYGPVRNAFDAGSIHYEGKWEGVGPWKLKLFGPREIASSRQASAIWGPKKSAPSVLEWRGSSTVMLLYRTTPTPVTKLLKSIANCNVHKGTLRYIKKIPKLCWV